jgi:PAS domain S-box-containing protein
MKPNIAGTAGPRVNTSLIQKFQAWWIRLAALVCLLLLAASGSAEQLGFGLKQAPLFSRAHFTYAGKASANELEPTYSPLAAILTEFYDISLGLTTVFLLLVLYWSVALRRRVREQTEQIRLQLRREAALEENYRELFENANDMVYTQDLAGKFTSLNKAGEKVLGCTRAEALGRSFNEFIAPDKSGKFQRWMESSLAGTAAPRCEIEMLAKGGIRPIVEVSTRLIHVDGKALGVEGIARDITERKQAEEALRQSEERFSSAFRVSPVSIAISTVTEGRYLDVNESFLRLFGFARDDVVGHTATELNIWVNVDERSRIEKMLHDRQSASGIESKFRTKSGDIRTALVFMELIDLGSEPCALSITHDMTDRLRLEAQLRQAQKMEAVGRLAAGVAHDFNNMLTVIQGNTLMAMSRNNLGPELSKSLEQVSDAAQRAANLTRQLLTFSRKQVLQPKTLDLNELINNLTKMLKHLLSEDIVLKFNYAGNLPIILADATMMEQIIMNLAVNARDAMPSGGRLNISTTAIEIDKMYVANHDEAREGIFLCLSVGDTGCGMDAATQSRIFEPFFTTKEVGKGTGLGLATVYGIVKQHHGWLEVNSEVGSGTTFKIFLPCDKTVISPGKRSPSRRVRHEKETILVVEDEQTVGELVGGVLKENGYRVLEASSGLDALQVWNEEAGEIDLLLTDMKMPKGMSGHELAENLKALKPDLKVIYTSGYSPEVAGYDLELQEETNFLPKPYPPSKLLRIVRNCLNSQEVAAA